MEQDILVSIIMPTYNRAGIISRAIKSVLAQTYEKFELIIVDDGSEDNTKDVVESFKDNRIIYRKYDTNQGANFARNRGIEMSQGEYLAFIDSDNEWNEIYLKSRIYALQSSSKNVGGVFGKARVIDTDDNEYVLSDELDDGEVNIGKNNEVLIEKMLIHNRIDTNTIVVKRECLLEIGMFDENIKRLQDWECFLRVLVDSNYKIIFSNDTLVNIYRQNDSISSKKNNAQYWNTIVYVLKKYIQLYMKYEIMPEYMLSLCLNREIEIDERVIGEIIKLLDMKNITNIVDEMGKKLREKDNLIGEKDQIINDSEYQISRKTKYLRANENWLKNMSQGRQIADAIKAKGYTHVSIYGYGKLGRVLFNELQKANIIVDYIIDRNEVHEELRTKYRKPGDELVNGTVIIITVIDNCDEIMEMYKGRYNCLSLNNLIEEMQ